MTEISLAEHGAHDCGACRGHLGAVNARMYPLWPILHSKTDLETRYLGTSEKPQFLGGLHTFNVAGEA